MHNIAMFIRLDGCCDQAAYHLPHTLHPLQQQLFNPTHEVKQPSCLSARTSLQLHGFADHKYLHGSTQSAASMSFPRAFAMPITISGQQSQPCWLHASEILIPQALWCTAARKALRDSSRDVSQHPLWNVKMIDWEGKKSGFVSFLDHCRFRWALSLPLAQT